MNDKREALAAKVRAVNAVNKHAVQLQKVLNEVFRPLVGQPILKATGDLLVKVEKLLPANLNPAGLFGLDVYRHRSNYSLAWTVRQCEQIKGGGSCLYHELTVYVGWLEGNTLKELTTNSTDGLRSDYTVEEVLGKREAYALAKKAADDAHSALHPFGERDS
ncbi:MAG: hypothetical protein ACREGR_01640 [Minisyncoccia bacterium]